MVRVTIVDDDISCCCILGDGVYAIVVTLDDLNIRIGRLEGIGNLPEHHSDVVLWVRSCNGVQDRATNEPGTTSPGVNVSVSNLEMIS